ncbi:hypothetical protein B9Z55_013350 [Caenorhabditis nigoni]|uniref:Uncharacterized protein n=1 Tax=Caenorhabditis nigoni TaxID=1611254 RepID=A0A2G5U193_9PELO|nr:hypothetical protein B9Z55_013350 [Caenorhabditis nigoni]
MEDFCRFSLFHKFHNHNFGEMSSNMRNSFIFSKISQITSHHRTHAVSGSLVEKRAPANVKNHCATWLAEDQTFKRWAKKSRVAMR